MEQDSDSRRRRLGLGCLVVAAGLLLLGQTILKQFLDDLAFLVYWLACFLFTFAAIFGALIEVRSVRRRTREETRELFEKTIEDIDGEEPETRRDSDGNRPGPGAP